MEKLESIFASIPIRVVPLKEGDNSLAIASIQSLRPFIPEISPQNIDLLPIAFDACVVNRGNKNGDIINTETALSIYKTFENKFIDTEHNRQKVIGVILRASLSELETNRVLTEEEVRGTKKPFNITLGGVLWKAVNQDLCDLVEDSNDPTSVNYLNVSSSWELAFSGNSVLEFDSSNADIENAVEITNPEQIESLKKYLKFNGGSGVKDGKYYYRMPNKDVVAMGVGLTEKPAADVEGVAVKPQEGDVLENGASEAEAHYCETKCSCGETIQLLRCGCSLQKKARKTNIIENGCEKCEELKAFAQLATKTEPHYCSTKCSCGETISSYRCAHKDKEITTNTIQGGCKKCKESQNNFSQSKINTVKTERTNMKIESIKDITDESLKQCSASVITGFIASELAKASEVFAKQQEEKMGAHEKLKAQHDELHKNVLEMKATIDGLKKEKDEREQMDRFNHRMGEVHAKFDLPGDVAKHVGDEVKSCADEDAYAAWNAKAATMLRPFLRKPTATASDDGDAEAKKTADASFPGENEEEARKKAESQNKDKHFTHGEPKGKAPMEGAGDMDKIKAGSNTVPQDKGDVKIGSLVGDNFTSKAAIASAVDGALDGAKLEKVGMPNSTSATVPGMKEKYAQAFAEEGFIVKINK